MAKKPRTAIPAEIVTAVFEYAKEKAKRKEKKDGKEYCPDLRFNKRCAKSVINRLQKEGITTDEEQIKSTLDKLGQQNIGGSSLFSLKGVFQK